MAIKWGGRGFGLPSRWALAAASQPISAVDSTGWQATMPTPVDLALSAVSVSRQGYTSAGATTTYSETLYTTKRVRLPYPNQATLTTDTVALDDYVYSTDTLPGVTNTGAGNDPLFTSYQGTTIGPVAGAGNGTYTLQTGSPAKNFLSSSPVPFDLAGNARSGTVAAGAYV